MSTALDSLRFVRSTPVEWPACPCGRPSAVKFAGRFRCGRCAFWEVKDQPAAEWARIERDWRDTSPQDGER
jgi:hypothetical protein